MEETLFSPTITKKLHKEAAIQIAAFLGGPLAAGYLVAHNFQQLDEPEKARKTWTWSVLFFIVIIVLAFVVPDSVPSIVFAAVNAGVAHLYVQRFQSALIKAHGEAGGPFYRVRRVVFIALGCALAIILLVLVCYTVGDFYRLFG